MRRGWKPWAEMLMCGVGASFGASIQTFLVPLSRVFIWLLARDPKRECPEGSTWGDPVAVSHLEPCYMLPCPNNSCGKESSTCGEPTFTAILFTLRGNFKRGRETERETADLENSTLEAPQRSTSQVTHSTDEETEI